MYYSRAIEKTILELSKQFAAITIFGARQVGKTTVVKHLFNNRFEFVSLDDSQELYIAKTNPKLFLSEHHFPLIIDEIQKAPELLPFIKIEIDEQKYKWLEDDKPFELMYILTGSNQFELQKITSESLVGRTAILNMSSMSMDEKNKKVGECFNPSISILKEREKTNKPIQLSRRETFEKIFEGGMPELVVRNPNREIFFKSYIDTYMERDIRLLISTTSEFQFRNFLSLVALRTAQEVVWDDLSRNVGIDVKTCKRWMSILETSGIIVLLQPYMKNASTSIIKAPKVYFMDTGLCAYLCKWPSAEFLEKGAMSGAFFETFVVSEIIKSYMKTGRNYSDSLYYFRTMGQKEVDLLIVNEDSIYPIEIKKGIAPSNPSKNFRSLEIYKKNIETGLVIDSCDKISPVNESVYYCPVSMLSI